MIAGFVNGVVQIIECCAEQMFSTGHSKPESKHSPRRENVIVRSVALSPDESELAVGA